MTDTHDCVGTNIVPLNLLRCCSVARLEAAMYTTDAPAWGTPCACKLICGRILEALGVNAFDGAIAYRVL